MDALNQSLLAAFIGRLAEIFVERHPLKFGEQGIAGAEEFIRKKLPLARKYGIHSERAVSMFLYFLLVEGEDFESRPDTAWAVEILTDSSEPDSDARVQLLISRMEAYAAASAPAATS